MTVAAHEERVTDRVELIAVDLIDPADDNPRRKVGDVAELAQSIQALGLLEPLVVMPRGDRYLLVCGARRHAACIVAGLDATTCVIREFTETERQEAMLIENLQRVDLSVLEEATSYRRLVELGHSQRELAARVGRSQAHISKRLALLELPETIQKQVDSGGITLEDAQQLGKLGDYPKRLETLIKRFGNHGTIPSWAIEDELRSIARAKKVEQAIAKLKKAGETVVKLSGYEPPKGYARVAPGSWQPVDMDPAKHAKLDCHALGVTGNADVIELCSDAAKHPKKKTSTAAKLTKAQRDQQKREEQLQAIASARREFAGELVRGKKISKDDIVELALVGILNPHLFDAFEIAARMLKLELAAARDAETVEGAEAADPYDGVDPYEIEPQLRELAGRSADAHVRVTFAMAIAAIEETIEQPYRWSDADPVRYFAFLKRHGYVISEAEQAKLDEVVKAAKAA